MSRPRALGCLRVAGTLWPLSQCAPELVGDRTVRCTIDEHQLLLERPAQGCESRLDDSLIGYYQGTAVQARGIQEVIPVLLIKLLAECRTALTGQCCIPVHCLLPSLGVIRDYVRRRVRDTGLSAPKRKHRERRGILPVPARAFPAGEAPRSVGPIC